MYILFHRLDTHGVHTYHSLQTGYTWYVYIPLDWVHMVHTHHSLQTGYVLFLVALVNTVPLCRHGASH